MTGSPRSIIGLDADVVAVQELAAPTQPAAEAQLRRLTRCRGLTFGKVTLRMILAQGSGLKAPRFV